MLGMWCNKTSPSPVWFKIIFSRRRLKFRRLYGDRLAIGQPVILSVPGTVKPLATSQIESIDPQVNPQTQGLLVKALFNNSMMAGYVVVSDCGPGFN